MHGLWPASARAQEYVSEYVTAVRGDSARFVKSTCLVKSRKRLARLKSAHTAAFKMLDRASGMLLIPVGCLCSATGLLLMKGAADDRPDLPPWRNPRWLFGFALLGVLATAVEVLVLGVLPLSVVAPFAGLTIVFSLLIASSGLLAVPAERLSRADAACIALVLLGVTLVSAFGPHDSGAVTLPVLLAAYTRARFAGFVAVGVGGAALVLCPCGAALAASALLPVISAFAAASCG